LSHFILLTNWTDQGRNKTKDASNRYNSFKISLEKAGGKLIGCYFTFGEYDQVIIIEAPNDETVMSLVLQTSEIGNARIKTLKAFDINEGLKIIKDLP
jgi:uncharacterized protein with GYD domain